MRHRRNRFHSQSNEALPRPKSPKARKHVIARLAAEADAEAIAKAVKVVRANFGTPFTEDGYRLVEPKSLGKHAREERKALQQQAVANAKFNMVPDSVKKALGEAKGKEQHG